MRKIKKCINVIIRNIIKCFSYFNTPLYMELYTKFLKLKGMKIGERLYIANNVYFDGSDYSLITLEDGVAISKDVTFLTHDFSMNVVYKDLDFFGREILEERHQKNNLLILNSICVGKNTFIGLGSIILPGTKIGENCLIGAGSVVRGEIPSNSIVLGNPAQIISKTNEWLSRKADKIGRENNDNDYYASL